MSVINAPLYFAPPLLKIKGKFSWPELVGVQGTVAEATIERENPSVNAIIVPLGSVVTTDLRSDRVWVWVNKDGIVNRVPKIG
ncbi:hypothetical protein GYH30_024621 [Glycine max]|nr:hypothetical protein GYH30_024621 [Glycine max]